MRRALIVWTALAAMVVAMSGLGLAHASAQSADDDPSQVEAGRAVYTSSCAACHGETGQGTERGRPLTDIAVQGDRATHIMSVTDGKGNMPGFAERLSADEIEAAISYVRLSFVSDAATDDGDEGASDDELADTGLETPVLVIAGATLIAAGALVVRTSARTRL